VGLFGLVAVATAHEHWLKERDDVVPITGPLKAWVDQLPAKTLKKLEQNLAPALLVAGMAIVLGPDVFAEVRIREQEKRIRAAVSQSAGFAAYPQERVANNPGGAGVGANGGPPRATGWVGSIPASPDLGSPLDL